MTSSETPHGLGRSEYVFYEPQGDQPGWYFYDETWDPTGPYESEEDAQQAFEDYCHWLNTGEERRGNK